ncbi:MAG TPA: aldehyde ferredoxin oxidoreductase family protein [Anaerolineae bacterium]|nr:aldehyde ferredoxin oxidoreductase family protein [Anaerolineae bacterium]
MTKSYHNRLLRVNLTTGATRIDALPDDLYRQHLGGRGFIGYFLLREVPPDADPLGPDNKLIFAAGVLTGLPVAGAGRHSVGALSPLTGLFGEAESGGDWGAELKRAGFDAIIVEGRAAKPVYLWIRDQRVEIRAAEHLWGLTTGEAEPRLLEALDDNRIKVSAIGPAGERQVPYACIINELHDAAGRTGMGAAMGSKNLKAIAVRGTGKVESAQRDLIAEFARAFSKTAAEDDLFVHHRKYGTAGGVPDKVTLGALPTRNYQTGVLPSGEGIGGQWLAETILVDATSCFACVVKCKRHVEDTAGPYPIERRFGGPEYESVGALGSMCGVSDGRAVSYANQLCNMYGMDTISTGVTIAFAMECFERGILTPNDTGGLMLRFGDADTLVKAVELIGTGAGFGAQLGLGAARLAEQLGPATQDLALVVKRQEVPLHDPRQMGFMALNYAVSPTGADHTGAHNPEKSLYNSALICGWPIHYTLDETAALVRAATGWQVGAEDMLEIGERNLQLAHALNLRRGQRAADDALPARFSDPLPEGPLAGKAYSQEQIRSDIQTYYAARGWDTEGRPTVERLRSLGLSWVASLLGPAMLATDIHTEQPVSE